MQLILCYPWQLFLPREGRLCTLGSSCCVCRNILPNHHVSFPFCFVLQINLVSFPRLRDRIETSGLALSITWAQLVKNPPAIQVLLLSSFSYVRLGATPQTAAHQAPPSLGFSRQEHWSGLPFPSPMHESGKWKKSLSCVRLFATLWTAVYQAPPSMGFFRQQYWSWVPLPSPYLILSLKK